MGAVSHGPFRVTGPVVRTGIALRAGDVVETRARGTVNFGGGVFGLGEPVLTADGDRVRAPDDYPAPHLWKNSLICQLGGRWYQGGSIAQFTATSDGELLLAPNDLYPNDNRLGWEVTVVVVAANVPPSSSANLQVGWTEVVQAVQRQDGSVPLCAGKRTMLRMFFVSGIEDGTDIGYGPGVLATVGGEVRVSSSEAAGSETIRFADARALPSGAHNRDIADDSMMIELPLRLARGEMQIEIRAAVLGHAMGESGWSTTHSVRPRFFAARRETMLPLLVTNRRQGQPEPTMAEYVTALSGARTRFPFPEDGITLNPPVSLSTDHDLMDRGAWNSLLVDLLTLFWVLPDTPRDGLKTAVIHAPDTPAGGVGISVPWGTFVSRVDWIPGGNVPMAQETFAHELAHAYGQLHANACNAPWPFDDRLGALIDEPGVDVPAHVVRSSQTTSELMSYCGDGWPSTQTYSTVVSRIRA